MPTIPLSVIISTSPGRQRHLAYCLSALARQDRMDFEVIIVDDGSEGIDTVIAPYEAHFSKLTYVWRKNDCNISRSRNIGADKACSDYLVFLNGDVLLNPHALRHYDHYLTLFPHATLWGYVGCRKRFDCPSLWFRECTVNWLDFRFFPRSSENLYIHPELLEKPFKLAGGHNFALTQETFRHIGGFDTSFLGWGEEDVAFALQGFVKERPLQFVGDCWAEHMAHTYEEPFHTLANQNLRHKLKALIALEEEALWIGKKKERVAGIWFQYEHQQLFQYIQQHYASYNPEAIALELGQRFS